MEKKQEGLSVTWLSVWMNIALGALKCAIGLMAHSAALLADGLHSLVDLSTDVVALFGLKMAAKPRDDNHPYGHHRFASLSSLFIGLALLGFCVGLIISSLHQLVDGDSTDPAWPALAAAAVSLVAKEWLFLRTRRIARQEKSRLLLANALHHRTDSLSSALVLVALLAILFVGPQLAFLDKLVGIILGGWLGLDAKRQHALSRPRGGEREARRAELTRCLPSDRHHGLWQSAAPALASAPPPASPACGLWSSRRGDIAAVAALEEQGKKVASKGGGAAGAG